MNRFISIILNVVILFLSAFSAVSCKGSLYTVHFDTGKEVEEITVQKGNVLRIGDIPVAEKKGILL